MADKQDFSLNLNRMFYDDFEEIVKIPLSNQLFNLCYSGDREQYEVDTQGRLNEQIRKRYLEIVLASNDFKSKQSDIEEYIEKRRMQSSIIKVDILKCKKWSTDGYIIDIKMDDSNGVVVYESKGNEFKLQLKGRKPFIGFTQAVLKEVQEQMKLYILINE